MTIKTISAPTSIASLDLTAVSGGITGRWLATHPYAAAGFLEHHPARENTFASNHPCAFSRIQNIQNSYGI
ncbi:MAG TPA: hypothetical protein VH143_29100 [Kofleriaceae bacterium]|nr:hypothetical protein [Kofleriaceae bacterium]